MFLESYFLKALRAGRRMVVLLRRSRPNLTMPDVELFPFFWVSEVVCPLPPSRGLSREVSGLPAQL